MEEWQITKEKMAVEAKKITKEKAAAEVETQQRVVVMLKAQAMEVEA